ncbi:hypothetical protein QFC20_007850 [Naganishia adeliensis]|uniref:Uncharacterized protein n=1 Tax=Naganishia adeliensis TaxID=92952 RepID=A0ACC2UUW6_9TREE|nr:hypothetical protein QFC20_007850 [Naganishia adeliensis]
MPADSSAATTENGESIELSLRYIFIRLLSAGSNNDEAKDLQGLELVNYYMPYVSSEYGRGVRPNVLQLGSQEDLRNLESWVFSWIDGGAAEEASGRRIKLRMLAEVIGECECAIAEKHEAIGLSPQEDDFTTSLIKDKVSESDRVAFRVRQDFGRGAYVFRMAQHRRTRAVSSPKAVSTNADSAVSARSATVATVSNTAHLSDDPEHMLFEALTQARQEGLSDAAQRAIIWQSIQTWDPSPLRDTFQRMLLPDIRRDIGVADREAPLGSIVRDAVSGYQESRLSGHSELRTPTSVSNTNPGAANNLDPSESSKRHRFLQLLGIRRPSTAAASSDPSPSSFPSKGATDSGQ